MDYRHNFKKVLFFTKMTVYLVSTWPPPRTATRWDIMRADIAWWFSIITVLCLYFPLLYSAYVNRSNAFLATQIIVYIGSATNLLVKSIVFRIHRKRTQVKTHVSLMVSKFIHNTLFRLWIYTVKVLLYEMEDFIHNAQPHEQIILQRYIDKCSPLHKFVTGVTFIAFASVTIILPLIFRDKPLPTNEVYNFNVDAGLLKYLVSLHQSFAIALYSSGIMIDCQAALMVWFAGARLEILAEEITHVTAIEEFQGLIRKHKTILSFAAEASNTMSYVALASLATFGLIAISSALLLFGDLPFIVKVTFGPGIAIGGINLLISAWPADNLIHTSELLENAVYNVPWMDMGPNMWRNVLMVLQRCQRPTLVSIAGFVSCLSLKSYMSFISKIFSYFTTLRAVMMSDAEM